MTVVAEQHGETGAVAPGSDHRRCLRCSSLRRVSGRPARSRGLGREHDAVAPCPLRRIERRIRGPHERLGVAAVIGERRDADRHAEPARPGRGLEKSLCRSGSRTRSGHLGRRELRVSTGSPRTPRRRSGRPRRCAPGVAEDARELAQHLVAGGVAVRVVELLEVTRRRASAAAAGRPLRWLRSTSSVSRSWKWPVVVQAGEPIGDRELREPGIRFGELVRALVDLRLELGFISSSAWFFADSDATRCWFSLTPAPVLPEQSLDGEQHRGLVHGLPM